MIKFNLKKPLLEVYTSLISSKRTKTKMNLN
jgi:hypothetical protein